MFQIRRHRDTPPSRYGLLSPLLVMVGALLVAQHHVGCSGRGASDEGVGPAPRTQLGEATAVASGRWSDPATWGGEVPGPRFAVTIPEGTEVLMDTASAPLHSLHLLGTLTAAFDVDIAITSDVVMVHGRLEIGTAERPYLQRAVITLTGEDWDKTYGPLSDGMGLKVLGVMGGGALSMVGAPRQSWTHLDATATVGTRSLVLAEEVSWQAGDRIVVAPSDLDPHEAETFEVAAVEGRTLTLDTPVRFQHWGEKLVYGTREIDVRAEVGLLSRNIVVRGDEHEDRFIGGHTMFMPGTDILVDGVEFTRLGQRGVLARYPIHFHIAGDMTGAVVRNSSVHHSFHRCVVIHTTQNVHVASVVAYDTYGHCFFFEDGLETGNELRDNLGLLVRALPEDDRDGGAEDIKHDSRPSVYWITNPDNRFVGNVAAGADAGMGFWFDFIEKPTHDGTGARTDISGARLREFRENVAHSTGGDGNLGYGPQQSGSGLTIERLIRFDGEGGSAVIEDFTAYKNQNHGIWTEGGHVVEGAALADNRVAIANFHHRRTSALRDALVVGESDNRPPGAAPLAERLSAKFNGPMGVSINEGDVQLEDVTFANFAGGQAVALSQSTDHPSYLGYSKNVVLIDAVPYRFRGGKLEDEDPAEQHYGFVDVDGSLLGRAGPVTLLAGAKADFAVFPEDCSQDGAVPSRCAYAAVVVDVDGAGDGVQVTRPLDGQTASLAAQVAGDGWTARTGVEYALSAMAGPFVVRVQGAPGLPFLARVAVAANTVSFRGASGETIDASSSFAEWAASDSTGAFFDVTSTTVFLRVRSGELLEVCVNDTCHVNE
ncbi:MAG: G8 domain-containing protein [Myxococcota bacterium]